MTARRLLLAWYAAIAAVACQDAGAGPDPCAQGRCDDPSDQATDLMPRAPEAPGTISITRNQDSWYCEVIGPKGEIVLLSKEYASRTSALSGALIVEENGVHPERYVVTESDAGWAFVLRAANHVPIAESQLFATEEEARAAVASTRDLVAGIVQYKAAVTHGARFELFRDGSDWKFELLDESGETVLTSNSYTRRHGAINGIESVRANGKEESKYRLIDSPPRFALIAANGREIAHSAATYETLEAAEADVASTRSLLESERVANPW
jgi:uncharacterized protein